MESDEANEDISPFVDEDQYEDESPGDDHLSYKEVVEGSSSKDGIEDHRSETLAEEGEENVGDVDEFKEEEFEEGEFKEEEFEEGELKDEEFVEDEFNEEEFVEDEFKDEEFVEDEFKEEEFVEDEFKDEEFVEDEFKEEEFVEDEFKDEEFVEDEFKEEEFVEDEFKEEKFEEGEFKEEEFVEDEFVEEEFEEGEYGENEFKDVYEEGVAVIGNEEIVKEVVGKVNTEDVDITEISKNDNLKKEPEGQHSPTKLEVSSEALKEEWPTPRGSGDDEEDSMVLLFEKKNTSSDEFKSVVANTLADLVDPEHVVNVTFYMDDGSTFERSFHMHTNMFEVKETLAKMFQIKTGNIQLYQYGSQPDDWLPLAGLGAKSQGEVVMQIKLAHSEDQMAEQGAPKFAPLSTSIKVRVQDPDGSFRQLAVEVTNLCFYKLWCGGYRNKLTGTEYHNAVTQTRPLDRAELLPPGQEPPELFTRDTQTHRPYVTTSTAMSATKSTQMWRTDHYVPSVDDRILVPKKYKCYDELEVMKYTTERIVTVQKIIRGWVARRKYLKELQRIREEAKLAEEKRAAMFEAKEKNRVNIVLGFAYPNTRSNFYKLYAWVNEWWKGRYDDIEATKEGPARKAALYLLLLEEIQILFMVEKQRIKAKVEALRRADMTYLENTSRPKLTRYRKGIMTVTDSLENQRAREFKEIYSSYIRTDLSVEERIDVIVTLKHLLEGYEAYECLGELLGLLERELDLMALRVEDKYLSGLRKRIEEMMFDILKQPEFNPEAKLYSKVTDPRTKYLCHSCRKLLHPHYFLTHTRTTSFKTCHSCEWMATITRCQNMAAYQFLLKQIRLSEVKHCCKGATCFLVQAVGIHYIVTVIWEGRSAIGQSTDIRELRLPRWKQDKDWSPWNCILLTEKEKAVHEKIGDVEEFYDYEFVQKVKTKHALTRFHFYGLYQVDNCLRDSGMWDSVRDVAPYMDPRYIKELGQMKDPFFEKPHAKAFK